MLKTASSRMWKKYPKVLEHREKKMQLSFIKYKLVLKSAKI